MRHLCHGVGIVGINVLEQRTGLERDEILHIGLEVVGDLFARMFATERVGVFAFGQSNNADVHTFEEEQVDALDGGSDACIVGIEHESTVAGESLNDANVLGGQGSTRSCYDILEASLRHAEHIYITFDYVAEVLLCHFVLGFEQAVG